MIHYNLRTFFRRWPVMLVLAAGLTGLTALVAYIALGAWRPWRWLPRMFGAYAAAGTVLCLWAWWEDWRWEE